MWSRLGVDESAASESAVAPGFSYGQWAADAGVIIPSIVTLNIPHLGGPAYDVAADPATYFEPVAQAWGQQFADSAATLVPFERDGGAGAIQVLKTGAHATADPESWDARQVGALDGVALTASGLVAAGLPAAGVASCSGVAVGAVLDSDMSSSPDRSPNSRVGEIRQDDA